MLFTNDTLTIKTQIKPLVRKKIENTTCWNQEWQKRHRTCCYKSSMLVMFLLKAYQPTLYHSQPSVHSEPWPIVAIATGCAKQFVHILLFRLPRALQCGLSLFIFYRWENWGLQRVIDLPKVTQPVSGRTSYLLDSHLGTLLSFTPVSLEWIYMYILYFKKELFPPTPANNFIDWRS